MCVLAFFFNPQPSSANGSVLRVISNRDEYLARPTLAAHWWQEDEPPSGVASEVPSPTDAHNKPKAQPSSWILGGRDLRAGGSWFAVSREGRVAILTNYRDPLSDKPSDRTRGDLVEHWVGRRNAHQKAEDLVQSLADSALDYAGFNLLLFDCGTNRKAKAWVISNRAPNLVNTLAPGVHGLSNEILNSPWPKSIALKQSLESSQRLKLQRFEAKSLLALYQIDTPPDDALPKTGIPIERERYLSSVFIKPPATDDPLAYGTRCSTVLSIGNHGAEFLERSYYPQISERRFSFPLSTI